MLGDGYGSYCTYGEAAVLISVYKTDIVKLVVANYNLNV